jgi:hypothetical protein
LQSRHQQRHVFVVREMCVQVKAMPALRERFVSFFFGRPLRTALSAVQGTLLRSLPRALR